MPIWAIANYSCVVFRGNSRKTSAGLLQRTETRFIGAKKTFIIPFSAEFALRFLVPCMHATAHAITHLTVFKNQVTYMSIDPNYYEVRRHKISFYMTEG